jgi:hypothetical protein
MSGAIPPFPQYAIMARCSVKAQRQLYHYYTLLYFTLPYFTLPLYFAAQEFQTVLKFKIKHARRRLKYMQTASTGLEFQERESLPSERSAGRERY